MNSFFANYIKQATIYDELTLGGDQVQPHWRGLVDHLAMISDQDRHRIQHDIRHQRSVGGCTYHVVHPGGRNYDVFPVNANVAESRRVSRFWEFGHTPLSETLTFGATPPPATRLFVPESESTADLPQQPVELRSGEFPYTLDLRRFGS